MYKIGDFIFDVKIHGVPTPVNLDKFYYKGNETPYLYEIIKVDKVEIKESSIDIKQDEICIVKNGKYEKRYLFIPGDATPYALCEEVDDNKTVIYLDRKYTSEIVNDVMFVSLLSLEKRLHKYNQYILHSAYILHSGQAILFTGPSGIGKSTQADLWDKYKDIKIINGDRSVLTEKDGKIYACGCSYCGTSQYCENVSAPVKAIVILEQSYNNEIKKAAYKETVKDLFKQITINYYNEKFFNDALDFIDAIIENTNVYLLKCNISKEAVDVLYNRLFNVH